PTFRAECRVPAGVSISSPSAGRTTRPSTSNSIAPSSTRTSSSVLWVKSSQRWPGGATHGSQLNPRAVPPAATCSRSSSSSFLPLRSWFAPALAAKNAGELVRQAVPVRRMGRDQPHVRPGLHLGNDAAAPQGDRRQHTNGTVEHAADRLDEGRAPALHLADLVDDVAIDL